MKKTLELYIGFEIEKDDLISRLKEAYLEKEDIDKDIKKEIEKETDLDNLVELTITNYVDVDIEIKEYPNKDYTKCLVCRKVSEISMPLNGWSRISFKDNNDDEYAYDLMIDVIDELNLDDDINPEYYIFKDFE